MLKSGQSKSSLASARSPEKRYPISSPQPLNNDITSSLKRLKAENQYILSFENLDRYPKLSEFAVEQAINLGFYLIEIETEKYKDLLDYKPRVPSPNQWNWKINYSKWYSALQEIPEVEKRQHLQKLLVDCLNTKNLCYLWDKIPSVLNLFTKDKQQELIGSFERLKKSLASTIPQTPSSKVKEAPAATTPPTAAAGRQDSSAMRSSSSLATGDSSLGLKTLVFTPNTTGRNTGLEFPPSPPMPR